MKKKFLMFLLSSVLITGTMSVTSLAEDISPETETITAEAEDVTTKTEDTTTETENITAEAEDVTVESESGHTHYLCGETHQAIGDHTEDAEVEFTPWTHTDSLPDTAGNYYLTDNVTLTTATEYNGNRSTGYCGWDVPDGVVLCLNGHNITMQNPQDLTKDVDVLKVSGHFTLTDCQTGQPGKITHDTSVTTHSGKGAKVLGGTFDMYGGMITGNTSAYDTGGSGISVEGVTDTAKSSLFNLYGGQITGNTAKSGGGVNVSRVVWYGPSEFRMYGGSITNNSADSDWSSYGTGGGVYVSWTAKFVMNGGTISGNTASQFGGGIYASALAANNAYDYGGAATLEFSGSATITGNKVNSTENNLCLDGDTSNYQTVESKISLTGALNGTIGVNTVIAPTAAAPVTIATGAGKGTDYSKKILSDDPHYLVQQEGSTILLTTEGGYTHTHTWGAWQHDDNQHWQVCEICNQEASRENHNWDDGVITKEPTTTSEGEKTFTCEVCQATRIESVEKLPDPSHSHSYGTEWKSDKSNHWHECTCGDKADQAAHTFKWVVDKEATATGKGSKHQECTVCGYKESAVEIPATGAVDNKTDKKNDTTGTASKSDKTNNKTSKSDKKTAPKSGDTSSMFLWFALLAIGGGVVGTTVVKRTRHDVN